MPEAKSCFVIAPIGEPDSETRKRSDLVLKYVIRPAVSACGYQAVRADEIDKPGLITSQVIQRVVNDPLVVADLTDMNPNVFYELAVRHAIRRPLVQLIKKGETLPFDVAGTRTIHVDHRDLESAEAAKSEIIKQIKALEVSTSDMETPISVSLDLQVLRQSEKPEERNLGELVAAVAELRASLGKVEAKIGSPDQNGVLDEIQDQIREVPNRVKRYLDAPRTPAFSQLRLSGRKLNEFDYLAHAGPPSLALLSLASVFRDPMPWLYEMGLEAHKVLRAGDRSRTLKQLDEFREAIEITFRSPMRSADDNRETYYLLQTIESIFGRVRDAVEQGDPERKRPARKPTVRDDVE